MIVLTRQRTEKAIKSKYRGKEKQKKDYDLLIAQRAKLSGTIPKITFDSTFWKLSKTQLKEESNGKCAYCEANTEVVAHGDVEHYRPKSIYWWLAYTYDNYLYACQICNQIYKSDNFPIGKKQFSEPTVNPLASDDEISLMAGKISPDPIDTELGYSLKKYLQNHRKEKAYLLNPYFDDPSKYLGYAADDVVGEVKIVPLKTMFAPYVKAMEDYYGINRIELSNLRYETYRQFRIFKKVLNENISNDLKKDIEKHIAYMKSDKALFAGMIRYFDSKM